MKNKLILIITIIVALTSCSSETEWSTFTADTGNYTIDFPGTPEELTQPASGIEIEFQNVEIDDVGYSVSNFEAAAYDLDAGINGAYQQGIGTAPSSVEDRTINGHSCKEGFGEGTAQGVDVQNSVLVCFTGSEGYILQALGETDKTIEVDRFFDSFEITS